MGTLKFAAVLAAAAILTSCARLPLSSDVGEAAVTTEEIVSSDEISEIKQRVLNEMASRGLSAGMTVAEVKAAETLTLEEDSEHNKQLSDDKMLLISKERIEFGDTTAKVQYTFYNDSFCGITYIIDLVYLVEEYEEKGGYAEYCRYKQEFCESYGKPSKVSEDEPYPVNKMGYYSAMWTAADGTDDAYLVAVSASQVSLSDLKAENNLFCDTVRISFLSLA